MSFCPYWIDYVVWSIRQWSLPNNANSHSRIGFQISTTMLLGPVAFSSGILLFSTSNLWYHQAELLLRLATLTGKAVAKTPDFFNNVRETLKDKNAEKTAKVYKYHFSRVHVLLSQLLTGDHRGSYRTRISLRLFRTGLASPSVCVDYVPRPSLLTTWISAAYCSQLASRVVQPHPDQ